MARLLAGAATLALAAAAAGQTAPGTAALAAAGALGAGPDAGFTAAGTVEVALAQGALMARLSYSVWGSSHCRMVLVFPGGGRYEAVVNGTHAWAGGRAGLGLPPAGGLAAGCGLLPQGLPLAELASGGAGFDPAAPPALTAGGTRLRVRLRRLNPALAPPAAARLGMISRLDLDLDASSGLPVRAAPVLAARLGPAAVGTPASGRGQTEIDYADYTGDAARYPRTVTLRVNGTVRLTAHFESMEAHAGYSVADFTLPGRPASARPGPQHFGPAMGSRPGHTGGQR
ncbi:MAG TPA: hypothetical protein VN515_01720 [Terriglobales bacterium]|nr:hypothetical protein [Terriglobales bacterium]